MSKPRSFPGGDRKHLYGSASGLARFRPFRERDPLRAIGKTKEGRAVFIVFTLRKRGKDVLIRAISARYMHAKEVRHYEKENPELQK